MESKGQRGGDVRVEREWGISRQKGLMVVVLVTQREGDGEEWGRDAGGSNKVGLGGADIWKGTWAGLGTLGSAGDPAFSEKRKQEGGR